MYFYLDVNFQRASENLAILQSAVAQQIAHVYSYLNSSL